MAIPSRLMGSGVGAQAASNICGDAATGLTATGTTATDAYQLSAVVNQFSTVAASTGAKLMPTETGSMVIVRNSGASTLTLYPATGSTINGSASIAVPAATTVLVFATAGTTWFAMTAGAAVGVFTTITATGIASFADGTVGAPGVTFTSDSDCGVYRIGTNNVGVAVNGAKVLDVATTGLGITGTTSSTGAATILNATAIPAAGTAGAGLKFSSTANFGVFFGSNSPTLSAAQGSIYMRSDGSSSSTRAYINSDGGTTWVAITTAS